MKIPPPLHFSLMPLWLSLGLLAAPVLADDLVAYSTTAMAITGDIEFDDFGITFANGTHMIFDDLVADHFVVDGQPVYASVYSMEDPQDPVLENGNRLCGSGRVTYLATWGDADVTTLAVFTTQDVPASSADMCASYSFTSLY